MGEPFWQFNIKCGCLYAYFKMFHSQCDLFTIEYIDCNAQKLNLFSTEMSLAIFITWPLPVCHAGGLAFICKHR